MIRTDHYPEADILHVKFGSDNALNDGTQDIAPGVVLEFDPFGNPIGLEVASASRRGAARQAAAAE